MSANPAYQSSGLQSLALDENDIYEYEKSVGDAGGIADLGAIRERMEKLGRFGDDTLAHVETGELIVPKPLLDKMPELKESILGHLRDMGVEDPERYIVGSIDNSINPVTGSPEFFFKKVFRAVKSAVKSVAKVVKKAAPTLIKVAGTALLASTGVGLPLAAAISSGIGTLVGGGDFKDALLSAAIGGATGYLGGQIGEVAAGALGGAAQAAAAGGDAGDILKGAAFGGGGAAAGKLLAPTISNSAFGRAIGMKPGTSLSEDLSKTGEFFGITDAATSGTGAGMGIDTTSPSPSENLAPTPVSGGDVDFGRVNVDTMDDFAGSFRVAGGTVDGQRFGVPAPVPTTDLAPGGLGADFEGVDFGNTYTDPDTGFFGRNFPETTESVARAFESPVETFITGKESLTAASPEVVNAVNAAKAAELRELNLTPEAVKKLPLEKRILVNNRLDVAGAAAEKAALANQPSFLARNPYLATVPLVAAPFVMGPLMETPEMEKPDVLSDEQRAAMREGPSEELINQYRLGTESLFPGVTPAAERQTLVAPTASSFGFSESLRRQFPQLFAADGGGVFPRRTGGIMPDEGIPGKDSVKAMVMPGEFIFTTKAVKGAGNGDLRQGINNMYSVMRNLEARGERMA